MQGIISELESQGALPRSNSRVSSLATCCGTRLFLGVLQLVFGLIVLFILVLDYARWISAALMVKHGVSAEKCGSLV